MSMFKSAYSYLQLPSEEINRKSWSYYRRMIGRKHRELQNVIERAVILCDGDTRNR